MTTSSSQRRMPSIDSKVLLRIVLLLAAAVLALVFADTAASFYQVWQLELGAALPGPLRGLLDSDVVTDTARLAALLGVALFAGASLSCLVFLAERLLRDGVNWLRDKIRR